MSLAIRFHRYIGPFLLGITTLAIGVTWLGLLPWLSNYQPIRQHIDRNRQQGIDPAAMFYTEVGDVNGFHVRSVAGQIESTQRPLGHR